MTGTGTLTTFAGDILMPYYLVSLLGAPPFSVLLLLHTWDAKPTAFPKGNLVPSYFQV